MDCKVEAHVDPQHCFFLLSTVMTALFTQGRVAFGNFGLALASPKAHPKDSVESTPDICIHVRKDSKPQRNLIYVRK
jgi:hypothetical protein